YELHSLKHVLQKNRIFIIFDMVSQSTNPYMPAIEILMPYGGVVLGVRPCRSLNPFFLLLVQGFQIMRNGNLYPRIDFLDKITLIFLFPYFGKSFNRRMSRVDYLQLVSLKAGVPNKSPA